MIIAPAIKDLPDAAQAELVRRWSQILTAEQAKAWLIDAAANQKSGQRFLKSGDITSKFHVIANSNRVIEGEVIELNSIEYGISEEAAADLPVISELFNRVNPGTGPWRAGVGFCGDWPPPGWVVEAAYRDARAEASRMVPTSVNNRVGQGEWRKWDKPTAHAIIADRIAQWKNGQPAPPKQARRLKRA